MSRETFTIGAMAVDLAGFITYLKDHAVEHGFHVHDERHFIESYSLRQAWEVDMHPDFACDGPLDLNLAFDVEPRTLLALEDAARDTDELEDPEGRFDVPLLFNWSMPPLGSPPDLIVLSAELSGVGGLDLPIEVSAVDAFEALADEPTRRLRMVGKFVVPLIDVMFGREKLCDVLDRSRQVSESILRLSEDWKVLDSEPE